MDLSPFEITELERERWRMSISDDEMFGKNDDTLELRLPAELKARIAIKAASEGRTVAAYVRMVLMTELFGIEHIGILVARRYGLARTDVPNPVPTVVRTDVRAGEAEPV